MGGGYPTENIRCRGGPRVPKLHNVYLDFFYIFLIFFQRWGGCVMTFYVLTCFYSPDQQFLSSPPPLIFWKGRDQVIQESNDAPGTPLSSNINALWTPALRKTGLGMQYVHSTAAAPQHSYIFGYFWPFDFGRGGSETFQLTLMQVDAGRCR